MIQLLDKYRLYRDIQDSTLEQYEFTVKSFEKYLGRESLPDDYNTETVNRWLVWLQGSIRKYTVSTRRNNLLVLWRFGHECGDIPLAPCRIRTVKRVHQTCVTWTPAEVKRLIDHAEHMHGRLRGSKLSKSGFWGCWIRVAYDTALRPSDQFLLRCDEVPPADAALAIVQKKVGHHHTIKFRPATIEALQRFIAEEAREMLFPRLWKGSHFSDAFRAFCRECGLPGSPKKLRCTSATELERIAPGTGWVHLGHRNPSIAHKHYLGARAYEERPLPPLG